MKLCLSFLNCSEDDGELDHLDITHLEEEMHSFIDLPETDSEEDTAEAPAPVGIPDVTSAETLLDDTAGIAYGSCLLRLANMKMSNTCVVKGCAYPYEIKIGRTGTAMYLTWVIIILFVCLKYTVELRARHVTKKLCQ